MEFYEGSCRHDCFYPYRIFAGIELKRRIAEKMVLANFRQFVFAGLDSFCVKRPHEGSRISNNSKLFFTIIANSAKIVK